MSGGGGQVLELAIGPVGGEEESASMEWMRRGSLCAYRCGKKLHDDDTGGAYISPSFLVTLFPPYSPNFPLGCTGEKGVRKRGKR